MSCIQQKHCMNYLGRTTQILIPPLHSFVPLKFHPNHDSIKLKADSWVLSKFNIRSNHQRELLLQSDFPLLASTTNADGEESRVLCIAKFLAWSFAFDSINDNPINGMGSNLLAAEHLIQALMHALESKECDDAVAQQYRSVAVALDWWAQMHPDMAATQQSRFLESIRDCLDAFKSQISCRETGTLPDVQTYILMRRKASALLIMFILLEYALGIELDAEVLSHELILQLQDAVTDHVSWVNDLLSLKVEYSQGDYHNLPSVMCFHRSDRDMQSCVEAVCRMIKERENDCIRLMNEIKSSKLMERHGLQSYVFGLNNWISGNLHWSYLTARYHGLHQHPISRDAYLPVLLQGPNSQCLNEELVLLS